MQIQNLQLSQLIYAFDFVNIVFWKQQYLQVRQHTEILNLSNVVIVQIKIQEVR